MNHTSHISDNLTESKGRSHINKLTSSELDELLEQMKPKSKDKMSLAQLFDYYRT